LLAVPEESARAQVEGVFRLGWKSYFLYFGAIEPKKNIGRLIEAYLASGVHGPLVIAGKLAWKAEQELRLLADGTLNYLEQVDRHILQRQRIRRIDYTPFPLLVALIRGARAVLFPSLYEGFGLPVLEAMQLGTPVMTSHGGALREVAGDAALLVDPYDTLAMAGAIAALEKQDDLRADLAARGRVRATEFSGEHYAQRVEELYARLA
jgi:glycosyltransferase involved in cell wall biosynthesis